MIRILRINFSFLVIWASNTLHAQDFRLTLEIVYGIGNSWAEIEEIYIHPSNFNGDSYFLTKGKGRISQSLGVQLGKRFSNSKFSVYAGTELHALGGKYIFSKGHFFWDRNEQKWDINNTESRVVSQKMLRIQFPFSLKADLASDFFLMFSASFYLNKQLNDKSWQVTKEITNAYSFNEDLPYGGRLGLSFGHSISSFLALSLKWDLDLRQDFVESRDNSFALYPSYNSLQFVLHIKCIADR